MKNRGPTRFRPTHRLLVIGLVMIAAGPAVAQQETVTADTDTAISEATGLTSPGELEAFIDGVMAAQLPAHNLATATVSVVKDGELFFAKGYGFADRDQKTPVVADSTLFRPGSISKLFTWTAVMQLVEQGKLDLDADVNGYLTGFQIPATYPEPITMTHLLTHTPGFEDSGIGLFVESEDDLMPLREALSDGIPARVRPPFTYSSYSNYGTALAGLIIEEISGLGFNEYIEKNIFEPLEMSSSTFREPLPDDLAPRMAVGYRRTNGLFKERDFEWIGNIGPAGSLSSTATDMAKFMIAHLQLGRYGDSRILEEATARRMHGQLFTPDPRLPGMAHGFYESKIRGHHTIGHGGDTGLFHSDLYLFAEFNVGVFVSYVAGGGLARMELIDAFAERYLPERSAELPEPPDGFEERAAKLAGSYRFIRHNYSSIEKLTAMMSALKIAPGPDNTVLLAGPFSKEPWHFVEVAPYFFHQLDGDLDLAFREDDGKITHTFLSMVPFMPAYRVAWFATSTFNYVLLALGFVLFITTLVSAFRHRKAGKEGPSGARTAVRLGVAVSSLTILFLVSLVVITSASGQLYGIPTSMAVALSLPVLISILTVGVGVFAVLAWKNRWWTLVRRIHYSLFTLFAVGYVWFYYYWNVLGWQY